MEQEDIEKILREEESRLELERKKLVGEFQEKFEDYNPQEDKRLDLSDLMHNQYITRRQAQQWKKIEDDSGLSSLSDILRLCLGRCPDLSKLKSVVDYGVGSGKKSALAHAIFNPVQNSSSGELHLLDISAEMILNARGYCIEQGINADKIPFHRAVAFEDLGKIERIAQDRRKLHLFLGQTIGNFENPAEILRNIIPNMDRGEYLLTEWFCRKPEDYNIPEFEALYRDLFSVLGIPRAAMGDYDPHPETDDGGREWNVMSFTVQDVPEEERSFELGDKRYTLQPGTETVVSRSRRFKEEEIVSLCEEAGLEEVVAGWRGFADLLEKKQQKWAVLGDRRYGLFRKMEDIDVPTSVETVMENLSLRCVIGGQQKKFYIDELQDVKKTSDAAMATVDGVRYRFGLEGGVGEFEKAERLVKRFEEKLGEQKVRADPFYREEILEQDTEPHFKVEDHTESEFCLGWLAAVTGNLEIMVRMSDFLRRCERSHISWKIKDFYLSGMASRSEKSPIGHLDFAIEQFSREDTFNLLEKISQPKIFSMDQHVTVMSFLLNMVGKKDEEIFDEAFDLVSFYVDRWKSFADSSGYSVRSSVFTNSGWVDYLGVLEPDDDDFKKLRPFLLGPVLEAAERLSPRALLGYLQIANYLKGEDNPRVFESINRLVGGMRGKWKHQVEEEHLYLLRLAGTYVNVKRLDRILQVIENNPDRYVSITTILSHSCVRDSIKKIKKTSELDDYLQCIVEAAPEPGSEELSNWDHNSLYHLGFCKKEHLPP